MSTTPFEHLLHEHRALLAHYGRAQLRCTHLLTMQAREIERLQAEAMQLRARAIIRETELAFAREDIEALAASLPGLPRRKALAKQVEGLAMRMQVLAREVLHWQWRAARGVVATAGPSAAAAAVATADQPPRSVLCIARGDAGGWITQRMVDGLDGLVPDAPAPVHAAAAANALELEFDDPEALEASLVAADLVICQTGCLGHNDYWRVQDHCKRTGKACVMVDQPQVIHLMRGLRLGDTLAAPAQSSTMVTS
ncbi:MULTISPECIES: DUF2325 domain-containing protein [unclassified Acidovorax]|uniref:DUF2325 domain-containing protein n=1 Tax=unclassified Acidovorax TaxID=2684926 RepID=UPI002882F4E3|nr:MULTISPECIES: DUF2325 domain-containing protein [unclassified Acidovorax]